MNDYFNQPALMPTAAAAVPPYLSAPRPLRRTPFGLGGEFVNSRISVLRALMARVLDVSRLLRLEAQEPRQVKRQWGSSIL